MTCGACVVFGERLLAYDFGYGHPLAPVRVDLTMRLSRALGVVGPGGLPEVDPPLADGETLGRVHTGDYISAVRHASGAPDDGDPHYGLGTPDNPAFAGMHEASASVVGATVEAARRVWSGEMVHAASISGGLHHAMPSRASGFCVYNDPAVAISWLLDAGAERVGYVDIDVHHGDGVQAAFYDDPRVLTISLHESPQTLFPGTGYPSETGGPGAEGSAVNVALPPATDDAGWLRAFDAVVPPLLEAFRPDVLVTQQGCDSHAEDPLAHLMLSVDGHRAAYLALHELAHQVCSGRWVATGGGGYALVEVVPRSWTHLLAVVAGRPLDPATTIPEEWRSHVRASTRGEPPQRMTDGREPVFQPWPAGSDAASWLDAGIRATREAVFPRHGLRP